MNLRFKKKVWREFYIFKECFLNHQGITPTVFEFRLLWLCLFSVSYQCVLSQMTVKHRIWPWADISKKKKYKSIRNIFRTVQHLWLLGNENEKQHPPIWAPKIKKTNDVSLVMMLRKWPMLCCWGANYCGNHCGAFIKSSI